jgi:hypothetical protein
MASRKAAWKKAVELGRLFVEHDRRGAQVLRLCGAGARIDQLEQVGAQVLQVRVLALRKERLGPGDQRLHVAQRQRARCGVRQRGRAAGIHAMAWAL